jgi:hypothetical protein
LKKQISSEIHRKSAKNRISEGGTTMDWSVYYLEQDGLVFAKTTSIINWDKNKKLSEEALSTGRKYGSSRFLIDHRDGTLNLSILEIDDIPKMFKEIGLCPSDKMAILYKPDSSHSSEFIFFQNVSLLSSLQVKVFTDKEQALYWLKSESFSNYKPMIKTKR